MAGSKSDYMENKLLDHIFGKGNYTPPTIYVALFTSAPTDAGGGTEVSGGSYARVQTAASDWDAASGGSTANANKITFPEATASWGTVVAFALFDASTAGNMLYWADLTANKTIDSGDTAEFAVGALVISED